MEERSLSSTIALRITGLSLALPELATGGPRMSNCDIVVELLSVDLRRLYRGRPGVAGVASVGVVVSESVVGCGGNGGGTMSAGVAAGGEAAGDDAANS